MATVLATYRLFEYESQMYATGRSAIDILYTVIRRNHVAKNDREGS